MKKEDYQDVIDEISCKLANKILRTENDLANRALNLDRDIADQLQSIGQQTTRMVLEKVRDELVENKKSQGLTIHRNPVIDFNTIFGKIEINSPYLYLSGISAKPLRDEMNINHNGRSLAVDRALADFGIEESFAQAAKRFAEHYHFEIGPSAVARATKQAANEAEKYLSERLSGSEVGNESADTMLIELDGCEIRVAQWQKDENSNETTTVYNNPKKIKLVNWRDVRIGFARPLQDADKTFVGRMDSYPVVVGQLHDAALMRGMTPTTAVVGVADGGNGLFEELQRQFPNMQFILDKSHLKDHFYETAEQLGIAAKDRPAWVNPRIEMVSSGKVDTVLEQLQKLFSENGNDRLRRLIGYLKRFKQCLNYGEFKQMGYPIGSGEIESAHKYVVQKRLKIAGASWHPDSINPMLSLRVLRADDYWEDFWDMKKNLALAA